MEQPTRADILRDGIRTGDIGGLPGETISLLAESAVYVFRSRQREPKGF